MKKIVKIGALSLGKIMGLMYAIMGLIFGGLVTLFSVLGGALFSKEGSGFGFLFGLGAIIMLPIFYGLIGFVFGAFSGWLFNLIAGFTGGLDVDIQEAYPAGQVIAGRQTS